MTKTDEIISHLNCARNKKLQGHASEAFDELLEALILMQDTPRAEERINRRCRRMSWGVRCKACIEEDKEDARG